MRERVRLDETATTPSRRPITQIRDVVDKVVVLNLVFHRPGMYRRGDMGLVETESDKEMLRLSKEIVDADEYSDVVSYQNVVRAWIRKRSLPSPLRRGTFLVPIGVVDEVNAYLDSAAEEYMRLAGVFVGVYPQKVEAARSRLKDQFDERNYPTADIIRNAFYLERSFFDFGVPAAEKIGQELWDRERRRAESMWGSTFVEVQSALRAAFRDLVARLAERLEGQPTGKKKTFHDSTIEKITEFIELFEKRNVANDAEMQNLVGRAREVLSGRTPDDVRKSDAVRVQVAREMTRVTTALDRLLIDAPTRRISFDD